MKTYKKIITFMCNHLLLFALTIVIFVLTVFVCIDKQSVIMIRAIAAFGLWSAVLICVALTEIRKKRK